MNVIIIQARMGSTRLPGKVMRKIGNKPMLYYMINQVKASKKANDIVIATTTLKEDDEIVSYAESLGVKVYRGSELDVLDRFYNCMKEQKSKTIIRLCADSPFIDFNIIDDCISKFEKSDVDYLSNTIKKIDGKWIEGKNGFPVGLAVEVFTFDSLVKAWQKGKKPSDREHVTEYIFHNPNDFRLKGITNYEELGDMRLIVDYLEDFELAEKIIENFNEKELFTMEKLKEFLNKNLDLKLLNSMHKK